MSASKYFNLLNITMETKKMDLSPTYFARLNSKLVCFSVCVCVSGLRNASLPFMYLLTKRLGGQPGENVSCARVRVRVCVSACLLPLCTHGTISGLWLTG